MNAEPALVSPGVPAGGQFATSARQEVGVDLDQGAPERLRDMPIPVVGALVLPDYETGDPTFPEIELTAAVDGHSYQATGVLEVDLGEYARWRRDDATDIYAPEVTEHVRTFLAERYGASLDATDPNAARIGFTVELDDQDDDSSTITTRLHEQTKGDQCARALAGTDASSDFWEQLHTHVSERTQRA